jgi:signal transduction histidine kinase
MERFIDSTLAYVRSGEDEALRQIDLSALIATIADDASDLGADISTALPDSLLLETRPTGLTRSLTNIIDNGRRHAASLHVALDRQQEVGDHWIVITIDDDGPGIPADQRDTALLPFRRLDQRTGCAGGAGLGLSTAQRIITGLGGRLRLDQSPAGGLRVRILLPAPLDS